MKFSTGALKTISLSIFGIITLIATVTAAGGRLPAQSKGCLRGDDVLRLRSRFSIQLEAHEDLCDLNGKTRRVLEALLFAEGLKFGGETPAPAWDQKILPPNWLDYLEKLSPRIRACPVPQSTGKESPADKHELTSLAYVLPAVPKTIFLCDSLFAPELHQGKLDILATLLHESRHQTGFVHVKCTNGNNKDVNLACDPNYQFKGGYAVDVEALLKIGILATNVLPEEREAALASALLTMRNSFNEPPELMEDVALLQTADGHFYRYDGSGLKTIATLPRDRVHIVPMQAFGVRLLRIDGRERALPFASLDGSNFTPETVAGDVYAPYDHTNDTLRALFRDARGADPTYTFIVAGHVMAVLQVGIPAHFESYNFVLPRGAPVRIYETGEIPNAEGGAIYVSSDRDELFKAKHLENGQTEITAINNPYRGFVAAVRLNGKTVLLDNAGGLFVRDAAGTRPAPGSEALRFVELSPSFEVFAD